MPITLTCDCKARLNVPDRLAGKNVRCPKCKAIHAVPSVQDAALAAEPTMQLTAPEREQAETGAKSERGTDVRRRQAKDGLLKIRDDLLDQQKQQTRYVPPNAGAAQARTSQPTMILPAQRGEPTALKLKGDGADKPARVETPTHTFAPGDVEEPPPAPTAGAPTEEEIADMKAVPIPGPGIKLKGGDPSRQGRISEPTIQFSASDLADEMEKLDEPAAPAEEEPAAEPEFEPEEPAPAPNEPKPLEAPPPTPSRTPIVIAFIAGVVTGAAAAAAALLLLR